MRAGSGHRDNSRDSCMMRLMLGDFELNVGPAIVGEEVGQNGNGRRNVLSWVNT